ncbi:DUF805 domain-containing protein [Chloroflexota bacterium]
MIIECPNCGAKNSTDKPPEPDKRYRCGKCGELVSYQSDNANNRAADYPDTDRESAANMMSGATGYPPRGVKGMAPTKNSSFDAQARYKTNPEWSIADAFRPGGRFSRYQYLFFSIIVPLPFIILFGVFGDELPFLFALLALPLIIVLAIMSIISAIRRLHDTGHSGWWYLLTFIPLVDIALWLYLVFKPGKPERNKWG